MIDLKSSGPLRSLRTWGSLEHTGDFGIHRPVVSAILCTKHNRHMAQGSPELSGSLHQRGWAALLHAALSMQRGMEGIFQWSKLRAPLKNASHFSPGDGTAVWPWEGERQDRTGLPKCLCLGPPKSLNPTLAVGNL